MLTLPFEYGYWLYHRPGKGEDRKSRMPRLRFGIRAVATTGRAGYLYRTGAQFALVIRSFFVNPPGEYVDIPWTEPET